MVIVFRLHIRNRAGQVRPGTSLIDYSYYISFDLFRQDVVHPTAITFLQMIPRSKGFKKDLLLFVVPFPYVTNKIIAFSPVHITNAVGIVDRVVFIQKFKYIPDMSFVEISNNIVRHLHK